MAIKELNLQEEAALKPIWMAESIDRGSGDTHQGVTVTVDISDSSNVTAVSPTSKTVNEGETATFTLTFASEKDADDITVTGGTVSGTTLTVADVTESKTVTVADKV